MANTSNIEWTEVTWNPTTGCNKVSEGCKNCYAERWAYMQQKRGIDQYKDGFKFKLAEKRLNEPYGWKSPKIVFVNSMSDLFHEEMPFSYLQNIFSVMNDTPRHTYQILTKRVEQLQKVANKLTWSDNIWIGVSVESNKWKYRIDALRKIEAKIKFVSFEPLLEKIENPNLDKIDWIIVGGESGGKARKIEKSWIESLEEICKDHSIPFFFKQWGKTEFNPNPLDPTINKLHPNYAKGGCLLNEHLYRQLPH